MIRFNNNIDNIEETCVYFKNRAMQLQYSGYIADPNIIPYIVDNVIVGTLCKFTSEKDKDWYSLYILKSHRGKGHYKRWIKENPDKWIITTPGCGIYDAVSSMTNQVYCEFGFSNNPGYEAIEEYYGSKSAKRADVFYMQHIDEGLVVLNEIFASWAAKTAFSIHPLCQNNTDLYMNFSNYSMERFEKRIIVLAMEYRNIANSFLSPMDEHPGWHDHTKIKLSPLNEVNQMLVADKIQNYKNFYQNYRNIHPRSDFLQRYFEQWGKALEPYGFSWDLLDSIYSEKFQIKK